ncbi:PDR/VanB family oxidoreductase [Saccharopolyspora indica]|uniref:PDR/VanB family oxidoreductase n=1 Tax=Saccharopolyspora indica TaxID=1229659 RepID=UPI0035645D39
MARASVEQRGRRAGGCLAKSDADREDDPWLSLGSPDGTELPPWTAGAHVDLVLSADLTRQYSLCGDPGDRSVMKVAVLREPDGRGGSQFVHDKIAVGSTLRVRGPRNNFPVVDAESYLFIAGGIGITPLLPMIAQVALSGRSWRLAYGGRTRASMAYREFLEAEYPGHVEVYPMDEVGLLDLDALLAEPGSSCDDKVVYCCGPEGLLTAVETACADWPQGSLHIERFAPKAGADDGPRTTFEVELAESQMTLTVPADKSILEVVEDAGIQILSSCQEGTCGTCETALLEGVADHRDSVLTDDERAANDTMMICVSRACSSRLVLDL